MPLNFECLKKVMTDENEHVIVSTGHCLSASLPTEWDAEYVETATPRNWYNPTISVLTLI